MRHLKSERDTWRATLPSDWCRFEGEEKVVQLEDSREWVKVKAPKTRTCLLVWYFEHAYTSFRAQSFSHEQAETYASGVGGFDVTYRESTSIDISTDTKQSDVQIGTAYRDAIAALVYQSNFTPERYHEISDSPLDFSLGSLGPFHSSYVVAGVAVDFARHCEWTAADAKKRNDVGVLRGWQEALKSVKDVICMCMIVLWLCVWIL